MKLKHVLFSSLMLLSAGTAWADVMINVKNFPDTNFRSYLTSQSYGSDGLLSDAEIASIRSLMLSGKSIQNFSGIKFFTALQYLSCDGNQLTSLDISGCESLIELDCSNNKLTSLNVSGCSELKSIICTNNQIKGDAMNDLIKCLPTIQDGGLYVINMKSDGNAMTNDQVAAAKAKGWIPYYYDEGTWMEYSVPIPISKENFPDANFRDYLLSQDYGSYGNLTDAEIARVTSIDVSYKSIQSLKGIEYFTALTSLYCNNNKLTSLDVSKNTALTELRCYSNQLTSLNVSKNTALTYLNCYYNKLASLDVSKNTAMTELVCYGNQLTLLDVSGCTALKELNCHSNQLTLLDVSKNTALTLLSCSGNQLTSLDVAGCTALKKLYCSSDWLQSLDVSKNTALTYLNCSSNFWLQSLDVSKNTKLDTLYCSSNEITSLDVKKCTKLKKLSCDETLLTSLDVSKNTALRELSCKNNLLSSLDASGCTALRTLSCDNNRLTALNVSGCTALWSLSCYRNLLSSLDVTGCTSLVNLYCYQNKINGDRMDTLVASLRTVSSICSIEVKYFKNEQNEMTTTQVAAAYAKGWRIFYTENGTVWHEYAGVDPSTGVNNIEASETDDPAPWYTINGVELTEKPTIPGIYIHGGKKVIVK